MRNIAYPWKLRHQDEAVRELDSAAEQRDYKTIVKIESGYRTVLQEDTNLTHV